MFGEGGIILSQNTDGAGGGVGGGGGGGGGQGKQRCFSVMFCSRADGTVMPPIFHLSST